MREYRARNVPTFALGNEVDGESMIAQGTKHMAKINAIFDNQPIRPSSAVELPFQCSQTPLDPYLGADADGWMISRIPDGVGAAGLSFTTLSVSLEAATTTRPATRPDAEDVGW